MGNKILNEYIRNLILLEGATVSISGHAAAAINGAFQKNPEAQAKSKEVRDAIFQTVSQLKNKVNETVGKIQSMPKDSQPTQKPPLPSRDDVLDTELRALFDRAGSNPASVNPEEVLEEVKSLILTWQTDVLNKIKRAEQFPEPNSSYTNLKFAPEGLLTKTYLKALCGDQEGKFNPMAVFKFSLPELTQMSTFDDGNKLASILTKGIL